MIVRYEPRDINVPSKGNVLPFHQDRAVEVVGRYRSAHDDPRLVRMAAIDDFARDQRHRRVVLIGGTFQEEFLLDITVSRQVDRRREEWVIVRRVARLGSRRDGPGYSRIGDDRQPGIAVETQQQGRAYRIHCSHGSIPPVSPIIVKTLYSTGRLYGASGSIAMRLKVKVPKPANTKLSSRSLYWRVYGPVSLSPFLVCWSVGVV
jgi:hypothetical protein